MNSLLFIILIFCHKLCDSSRIVPISKWEKAKIQGHQSPINIITSDAEVAPLPDIRLISFNDESNSSTFIENNGHTIKVSTDLIYTLSGGPLIDDYEFEEMHFHWKNGGGGSEHKIDDRSFDMELHFVFFKKSFKTFKSAINYLNGLAVIAVLCSFDDDNDELEFFSNIQRSTKFRGNFILHEVLNLIQLIPLSMDYFTYDGSLTTPPYPENVKWIIFRDPLDIRQLVFPFESSHRPIQSIGDRSVYLIRRVHKNN